MNVKGNHPLAEVIAKCLFGIETVPKEYMRRMVNRACKEAVKYHEDKKAEVIAELTNFVKDEELVQCLCVDCRLNESCQFTSGKERYGCSVYYIK